MRGLAAALALAAAPAAAQGLGDALRATDHAVHYIEQVGPSVRVTTLTGCERRAILRETMTCVRFAARHAWHFDDRTIAEPDIAYAELPSGAAAGRCEPWQRE